VAKNIIKPVLSAAEAVSRIGEGSSIMVGGFNYGGIPYTLIEALVETGTGKLTLVSNDTAYADVGHGVLVTNGQVRKVICSHIGLNKTVQRLFNEGKLTLELSPQGTFVERIRAGGRCLSMLPGSVLVASDFSFGLIRGGHIDYTVLGALQVDEGGSLANWWIPGKIMPGMGGAMDLVTGVKQVIVGMLHANKNGKPKLVPACDLPYTGVNVVDMVVTEWCVMRFIEGKMTLCELAPEINMGDLREITEADFAVSTEVSVMQGAEKEQQ
jgi:acetate CoA/acetoacetate CoA-transferase beta subunit